MKYMYICIIFVMMCCTNQQNIITFSPLKTQQLNASDTLFEPFYGNWNYIVRDSMSFGITIKKQDNTLLLSYSNVLYSGSILNAQSDTSDYASIIQTSSPQGDIIKCLVKNYYDEQQYALRLELSKDKKVLFWEIYGFNKSPVYLPIKVKLEKE